MSELNAQTKELFNLAEEIADARSGGRMTIMRLDDCWKVMFYTPDMTNYGETRVFETPGAEDLATALRHAIVFG